MRYDLIPPQGLQEVHKVLSEKLEKYSKNEWKLGLSWTDVLSHLKKHLLEFETGNDYTKSGCLNIAEVASDALILAEYFKVYPQGDDRVLGVAHKPIVALDLDDTVLDFRNAYEAKFGKLAEYWNGDYNMLDNLTELQKDKDFWINMKVKNYPTFEPDFYCTARSIPKEWTEECIRRNGLPAAPVYTLPWDASKIDTLKKLGVTIMIDDKFSTFKECQANGIFCYLMDSPSNKYYNVGHRRIYDLNLNLK